MGQVAYDETRVQAISPKVDGWVEQLFVNATGQPVSRGDPLLTLYSPMLVSAEEELLLAERVGERFGRSKPRRSAQRGRASRIGKAPTLLLGRAGH